jgi:hypothetical protein
MPKGRFRPVYWAAMVSGAVCRRFESCPYLLAADMATQLISFLKKRRVDWFEELKIGLRTFGIEGAKAVLRGDILSM